MAVAPHAAPPTFELAELARNSFVVSARGDLERDDAVELRDLLFPLIAADEAQVVLDLGQTTAVDPAVIGVIDSAASMMRRAGNELRIVARDPRILWLLELTGIDQRAQIQRGLTEQRRPPTLVRGSDRSGTQ